MELLKIIRTPFSRRNFFLAGLSVSATSLLLRIFSSGRKEIPKARFLSTEGKLVEIEVRDLPLKKQLASTEQVIRWCRKN